MPPFAAPTDSIAALAESDTTLAEYVMAAYAEPLADRKEYKKITSIIPLGRVATAEEIAGPILFLASDLATGMTGEILNVNCGSVLCG